MRIFDGAEAQERHDHLRMERQHDRVRKAMVDGNWRTLQEIADLTKDPVASISAQLRHLRKPKFGSWIVERRARHGNRERGLFEYRLQADLHKDDQQKFPLSP